MYIYILRCVSRSVAFFCLVLYMRIQLGRVANKLVYYYYYTHIGVVYNLTHRCSNDFDRDPNYDVYIIPGSVCIIKHNVAYQHPSFM